VTFKTPDSPYWIAEWTDEGGRRHRTSTKKTSKKEADVFEADLRVKAERIRLGLEVRERNPQKYTVAEAAQWWLDNIAAKQKQHAKVTYVVNAHIVRDHGARPLQSITAGLVNVWLADKRATYAAATCNRLRSYFMSIFSRLIERELYSGENPLRRARKIKAGRRSRRAMPATSVRALIDEAPTPMWRRAIMIAAFTGMRRSEIERLRWADVDLTARIVSVRETKTDVDRTVGIHSELVAELLPIVGAPSDLVVPALNWNASATIVRRALARAGLDRGNFHGLRGAWATTLMAGGAMRDVVRFMGWGVASSDVMAIHYIAYPPDVLRREIDKLVFPARENR
jgi:integrase